MKKNPKLIMKLFATLLLASPGMGYAVVNNTSEYTAYIDPVVGPITNNEIRDIMIKEVLLTYRSCCPCPYSPDSLGGQCGAESLYYKPGYEKLYCYRLDISSEEVNFYRLRKSCLLAKLRSIGAPLPIGVPAPAPVPVTPVSPVDGVPLPIETYVVTPVTPAAVVAPAGAAVPVGAIPAVPVIEPSPSASYFTNNVPGQQEAVTLTPAGAVAVPAQDNNPAASYFKNNAPSKQQPVVIAAPPGSNTFINTK